MMIRKLGLITATVVTLLAAAEPSEAQMGFGYGRGGWRGGRSWYGDAPYASYGRGYYSPGYGYDRYGWGDGDGWYGRPYRGFSLRFGSPGGYYFPNSGFYSSSPMISSESVVYDSGFDASMQGTGTEAFVRVRLPAQDAQLWIEGQPTQQMGMNRLFVSPPLEAGKTYSYTLKATWTENGQEVTRERTLDFRPGQQAFVNFAQDGGRYASDQPAGTQQRRAGYGAADNIHAGEVVRVEDNVLIMRGADGREHRHTLATNGTVMIEGRTARLVELRPGMRINVTTQAGNQATITRIESVGTTRASDGRDREAPQPADRAKDQPPQPQDRPASPPPGNQPGDRAVDRAQPIDPLKDAARRNPTPPPPPE